MTQEERKAHSKEVILSASMHEFGAHGYASVTVDSICAKHGISKGMLYHYYSGKDDLDVYKRQVFRPSRSIRPEICFLRKLRFRSRIGRRNS